MMRIAINASIVDPVPSGLGVYTINVLRELAKLHDELVIYTSCPEVCGVTSTKFRRISHRVRPSYGRPGHITRMAWIQTSLPFRLLADKISLLFSPLPEGMLFSLIPQIVVVHDLIPLHFPESLPRQCLYYRYFVPFLLRRSQAIVAVSENTKKDIVAMYGIEPSKVRVVPNGLDASHFRVGIDVSTVKRKYELAPYLLYVGNILPHKNLRRLLQAFASIAKKVSHKLVIVGKKDYRYHPALEAEAKALGIEERVFFLDYVPSEELPALYAGAEAFILSSLYEGFGLPVLEAMACGTPVIASRVGALPEVAAAAAVLIDPHDVQGMASAMAAVLGDPTMREAMRQKGLEQAQRFSWERTALLTLDIIREVEGHR